ncbi:hypothetical protein D9M68_841530 [compost metagenome]
MTCMIRFLDRPSIEKFVRKGILFCFISKSLRQKKAVKINCFIRPKEPIFANIKLYLQNTFVDLCKEIPLFLT